MPRLPWPLGPIAHRGLHDAAAGIIENTPSAVTAAIAKGYAVEVDVQAAKGGVPVVFHDRTLQRLIEGAGAVDTLTPAELGRLAYKVGADRIVTLDALLEIVGGRVPLVIEVKTGFTAPGAFEEAIARSVRAYRGPLALMSFDPFTMMALKAHAAAVPRGLLSYRWDDGWMPSLSAPLRRQLRALTHLSAIGPSFIAYDIDDLPAFRPLLQKRLRGLSLLTWTVRTSAQRAKAARYADAIIFEGFEPPATATSDRGRDGARA